jgi:hypothetical protein
MSRLRFSLSVVCALGLATVSAAPAFAQRANGPFGSTLDGPDKGARTQGLDLNGSMFGVWDQDIFPASEATTLLDPRLTESGASGGLSGSLAYDRHGDWGQFNAAGAANAREYVSNPQLIAAYQGNTSFSTNITPKIGFTAGGSAAYSPFFQFAPFLDPGMASVGPLTGGFQYAAVAERNLGLDASVGLTDNFTRRTSLYISASGHDWRLLDDPQNNLRSYGAEVGLRHSVTRTLSLHLGYGRQENQFAFANQTPYVTQTINAGLDYGDSLAFARRAAFSFGTSTEAMRFLGETHYRLNGHARLTRGFSRTWSTWIGYERASDYRLGFRAPLLTDQADAGIGGLAAWRVKWSTGIGYTHGTVGFGSDSFSAYSASTRADWALTRQLSLFTQYAYYHYELPTGSTVLDVIPRFSRQVATVGLSVWVPIINDVRPPKEPR